MSYNHIISMPGSKSYTNRALIMAVLTEGSIALVNYLESDDTFAMIECLKKLGIRIKKEKNSLVVENDISVIQDKLYELNANLSGTTIRFILAVSCIVPGVKKIFGEAGLNKRPIKDLVLALTTAGAEIKHENKYGFPPIIVKSNKLQNGEVYLSGEVSSQFISALLMISPIVDGVTIQVDGDQISKSYIDITIAMMSDWGVKVENYDYKKYVIPSNQK